MLPDQNQQPQELVDPRKWLKEEGFLDTVSIPEQESSDKSADDIITSIQTLLDEYDVEYQQCSEDVLGLLEDMLSKGLIEVKNGEPK